MSDTAAQDRKRRHRTAFGVEHRPKPRPPSPWLMVVADGLGAAAALPVAYGIRVWLGTGRLAALSHPLAVYTQVLPEVVALWLLTGYAVGLYRTSVTNVWGQVAPVLRAGLFGSLALAGAAFLSHFDYSRAVLVLFGLVATALELGVRLAAAWAWQRRVAAKGPERALIVGTGELARVVAERLASEPPPGHDLVGFISTNGDEGGDVVGHLEDLPALLDALQVEEVFMAAPNLDTDRIMTIVDAAGGRAVFYLVDGPVQALTDLGTPGGPGRFPVLHLPGAATPSVAYLVAKRLLDVIVSALLLLVLAPVLLVVAWLVRRETGASALFVQERIGYRGRPFKMYKFRTMRPDVEPYAPGPETPDDPRVTRIGRWLRRYSLDELPQLFNVLRGEMSLVGPRPEMPFLVERYRPWQRRRLDAKPGITGLWQIMGRKDLPLIDNIEYDFYYLRHQSLLLDLEILLRTIPVVLGGKGAY